MPLLSLAVDDIYVTLRNVYGNITPYPYAWPSVMWQSLGAPENATGIAIAAYQPSRVKKFVIRCRKIAPRCLPRLYRLVQSRSL